MENLACIKAHRHPIIQDNSSASKLAVSPQYVFVLGDSGCVNAIPRNVDAEKAETVLILPDSVIVVYFGYNPELEALLILSDDGQVHSWNVEQEEIEVLAVIECGDARLIGIAWSPDGQYAAYVTSKSELVFVDQNFVNLFSLSLPNGSLESSDATISWKSDSNRLMVNYMTNKSQRNLSVIDMSEKKILFTNSLISGLTSSIDWNFSPTMVVAVQTVDEGTKILMIEPNTLPHDSFMLRTIDCTVLCIGWNASADILGILVNDGQTTTMQAWCRKNYHWYLKRSVPFKDAVQFVWDAESPYTMFILTSTSAIEYEYIIEVTLSSPFPSMNLSTVCVVDGNQAKITHFSKSVVPPPLCSCELSMSSAIISSCFSANGDLGFVLENSRVEVYGAPTCDDIYPHLVAYGQLEGLNLAYLREIMLCGDYHMVLLTESSDGESDKLVIVKLSDDSPGKIEQKRDIMLPQKAIRIFHSNSVDSVNIEMLDGSLLNCTTKTGKINSLNVIMAAQCTTLKLIPCTASITVVGQYNSQLCVNGSIIRNDVTSFCATYDGVHLVVTTFNGELLVLSLKSDDSVQNCSTVLKTIGEVRTVDRESRIIAVPDIRCILSHSRGNLETIVSRPLLILKVKSLLTTHQYVSVYPLMRVHRVDTNLLIDHSPSAARKNAIDIVRAIGKAEDLNLFMSGIGDTDTTLTTFSTFYGEEEKGEEEEKNKIMEFCSLFRSAMESVDREKYTIPILTSLIRSDPPDIVGALRYMWHGAATDMSIVEEGVGYLVLLLTEELVYKGALETCNMPLARAVLGLLERDPKEYIPLITQFEAISDSHYKRYSIYQYLNKHDLALFALIEGGSVHFDELMSHVKANPSLLPTALKHIEAQTDNTDSEVMSSRFSQRHLAALRRAYADHLKLTCKWIEAGGLFVACEHWNDALVCFEMSLDWRMCFFVLKNMQCEQQEMKENGQKLAKKLKEKSNSVDAGFVLLEFCEEVEEGIRSICEGREFEIALHMAAKYNRLDLIELVIRPLLRFAGDSVGTELSDKCERVNRLSEKLKQVRENASQQPLVHPSWRRDAGILPKRKKRGPKQNQEVSLVGALSKEIPSEKYQSEIHSLIRILLQFNEFIIARKLQSRFREYMNTVKPVQFLIVKKGGGGGDGDGYCEYRIEKSEVSVVMNNDDICML